MPGSGPRLWDRCPRAMTSCSDRSTGLASSTGQTNCTIFLLSAPCSRARECTDVARTCSIRLADHDCAPTPLRSRRQYEGFKPPYNVSRVQPYVEMIKGEGTEWRIQTSCTMVDCRTSLADANVCHRA